MIADDSPVTRQILRDMLESEGFEIVAEAKDGREAFKKFRELRPDIIFMDLMMPKVDGFTICREIKRIQKDAKIIVSSGVAYESTKHKLMEIGITTFLSKPFEEEELHEILKEFK